VTDLLLDTHVWIWVSIEDKTSLTKKARRRIQQEEMDISNFLLGAGQAGRKGTDLLFNTPHNLDQAFPQ